MKQMSHSVHLGTELWNQSVSLCTPQNLTGKFIDLDMVLYLVTRYAVGMHEREPACQSPSPQNSQCFHPLVWGRNTDGTGFIRVKQ